MDPTRNPFAPGAGTRPPELAGRSQIIDEAAIALARIRAGRPAKSQLLLGLRGVGKTVLLNRIHELADREGYHAALLEAPEGQRLAELLVPALRKVLFRLSSHERARQRANRALGILRRFAGVFKVSVADVEVGIDGEVGVADSGRLDSDLPDLVLAVAEAAQLAEQPVALLVDEVQYLGQDDLGALIVALHKVAQRGLPLVLFGAGLPQLAGLAGEAKSYAERLFAFPAVGPLEPDAARRAIREPIRAEGAEIEDDALDAIVERTKGYPYFLQEWGSHSWATASDSPIDRADVERATFNALAALDGDFFRVRLDRLTPRERDYMSAMASLGAGPHRSSDIAAALRLHVTQAAPLRGGLIRKGMIYSPAYGDTAFTVPMFDSYLQRTVPWTPPKRRSKKKT